MISKVCQKCKIEKDNFSKKPGTKDGYRSWCKDCENISNKEYHLKNKEAICKRKKEYQLNHYYNDKEQYYRRNAERRADLARVYWENDLTKFVLEEAFELAKLRQETTGVKWHVDHVVPLKGKGVCGLHVWNNFAVITAKENSIKGNRYVG